jgi:hypothetical protein
MATHSCITHSLTHVTHGIHNGARNIHTWRHHHVDTILHHGAHITTICICWCHMHGWANCGTDHISHSVKYFW